MYVQCLYMFTYCTISRRSGIGGGEVSLHLIIERLHSIRVLLSDQMDIEVSRTVGQYHQNINQILLSQRQLHCGWRGKGEGGSV